jgi:hypothetical protein
VRSLKKIKIICICIVFTSILTVSALNLFYPERPTVSEHENRTLAAFPDFTLSSLFNGSFFSEFDTFVSDNFIGREFLVDVAQKISSYHSISAFLPGHEDEVVFLPSKTDKVVDPEISENENTDNLIEKDETTDPADGSLTEDESSNLTVESEDQIPVNPTDKEIVPSQKDEAEDESDKPTDLIGPEEEIKETLPEENEESTPEEVPEKEDVSEIPQDVPSAEPVPETVTEVEQNSGNEAEFLSDGYIIYREAVYSIPYLVKSVAEKYGETVDKYAELFPESRVSILVAPLSSGMIENKEIRKKITDQKKIIDSINSYCGENINKLNVYDALYSHRNEYIYFRSDHHWTSLGA